MEKVFDVSGSDKKNGTVIHAWDKHGGANQSWFICSLSKEKVNENDCDGFGVYVVDLLKQPVDTGKQIVEGVGFAVQEVGSLFHELGPKYIC
jgi:hypothetical protein